ncbi:hypothetical protein GCM10010095_73100 [Streptomyces anthocyanicus]|uniref:DUF4011 domain-containing protein n=1 Tax=Streptomyces anthocyanicus TaxID=68174 RepID=UPI0019B633A8|nr:DUF4011 domain-containing protein [Streptomyces anthocyanicus]GGL77344.1 hypothetical protein GCM10010095_73100 [Streptomyces anthocyanicus]
MPRQGSLPSADRARLDKLLASWRDSLIDLSLRNRLLNYQRRSSSAGMDLVEPGLAGVLEGLSQGCTFSVVRDEKPDDETTGSAPAIVAKTAGSISGARGIDTPASRAGVGGGRPGVQLKTSKTTQVEQVRHLRRLALVAREKFNDYGLWVLHLGVGFLDWTPATSAEKSFSSPLVIVPVVLERRRGDSYVLKINTDEEPSLNPALAIKMGELGIEWPRVDQVDHRDIPELLARVRHAVAGVRGWKVTNRVVLDTFNSSKEVMYRDLLDNAARVQASALVRAIGLGADSGIASGTFAFDPVDTDRIDEVQPPENAPLVLDADSSQRQCVAAALEGRSFVMDGPPGTGKSQTITNMIAGLLEQGRTVLFVSEKAAALDVVRNRLGDLGLDDYVLALHSNNMGRKQVAQELGQALQAPRRTSPGSAQADLNRARQLRKELSGYAAAMNEIRPGLDASLHDVLGRISLLDDSHPLPPAPGFDAAAFSAERLGQATVAARQVSRSWRPAAEGTAFSWYGLTATGEPLQALDLATETLVELETRLLPHADLLADLGWQGVRDASRLTALLRIAGARPTLPFPWLTAEYHGLTTAVADFRRRLDAVIDAERSAERTLGRAWDQLPAEVDATPSPEETALATLLPPAIDISALTTDAARELGGRLEADAIALDEAVKSLAAVAAMYGLPAPETCDEALRLGRLADLAGDSDDAKPLTAWLTREGAAGARTAAQALREAVDRLSAARKKAEGIFTDRVLQEDSLEDVAHRFATVYRSITARLTAACRADRRLVRSLLPDGSKCTKEVLATLPAAVAWQQAARTLHAEVGHHAAALGKHWRGEDTDFDGLDSLIARADEILALAPRVINQDALAREVASGGQPRAAARNTAEQAAARLTEWRDSLVLPPMPGPSYELEPGSLRAAAQWSRAHVAPLRTAERLMRIVEQTAVADGGAAAAPGTWTLASARAAVRTVRATRAAVSEFLSKEDADRELLGDLYMARSTMVPDLTAGLDWIAALRESCGLQQKTLLSASAAENLYRAEFDTELEAAADAWSRASGALANLFRPERAEQLRQSFADGQDAAVKALAVLDNDRGGPDEWRAYDIGRSSLDDLGLGDLVDRAVRRGVTPADFPDVVERAVLRAWADVQLADDQRLAISRSADRDDLVAGFRKLDARLADHARLRVVQACDGRRPRSTSTPGAALLKREGEKKSRHKPVRELLEAARDTVSRVKPCFMMSPLTVSRFLPSDLVFDVVIFDEASQVLPQDAINCVYRGRALIVAGDQKQLPPTAFFSSADDDEEDREDEEAPDRFASVLDLCKASGLLESLSLRWHYRSRHEDLIAFSNREFYDESMTTFPGAHAEGEDVGVAFYRATEGVYRSGAAARNNPGEAEAVARRVIHHFSTRKGRSLGVVALSQSQAVAIQDAVDAARQSRPDLDECFSEDRLNGFFVKNLESVQGDERDVMILSVGYGPDAQGKFSKNFGPMNKADGWRRLNVAVTRARYRVEVVASFEPGEVGDTGSKSFRHFSRYLRYAQSGPSVLSQEAVDPDAQPESPFEESVLAVLRNWGYDVQPQVGVAGYRIDLGVRHPDRPGLYALGVECDGAMYHSSKAARDRDRLREGVLRGLGWELHRIWGTDWYRDRSGAEVRLRAAVDRAVALVRTSPSSPRVIAGGTAEPGASSPRAESRSGSAQRPSATRGNGTRTAAASPLSARRSGTVPAPRRDEATPAPRYPVSTLAETSRRRVENELSQIREYLQQPEPVDPATDYRVRADNRRHWEKRCAQLKERAAFLETFLKAVPSTPRVTGGKMVAPGRLIGLTFGGSTDVEEYEITSQSPAMVEGEVLSPSSPLAAALLWRMADSTVEYEDGSGKRRTAQIRHVRD